MLYILKKILFVRMSDELKEIIIMKYLLFWFYWFCNSGQDIIREHKMKEHLVILAFYCLEPLPISL